MGRSVSYPRGAVVAFTVMEIESDDDWDFEFEWLRDDLRERAAMAFPSLAPHDGWRDREDRILMRNAFADFGVSVDGELVAVWIAERDDGAYWDAEWRTCRSPRARLLLVPTLVVFCWFAARFGDRSKERKHERGAMLVPLPDLVAELHAHNRQERRRELAETLGWKWRLSAPRELARAFPYRPSHLATVVYVPGMVVELDRRQRGQKLKEGQYRVAQVDTLRQKVTLADEKGRRRVLRPGKLRPQGDQDPLRLFEVRALDIYAGDRIRWTATDHERGLVNADQARVTGIAGGAVTVRTSLGTEHVLAPDDPMLRRLDLAYALNAHMAQGLTSDRGIAVMDSRERNLSNQQTFLVTITRLRDELTLFVDDPGKLKTAVASKSGMKRSALETTDLLRAAAESGQAKGKAAAPAAMPTRDPPELDRSLVKPFEIGI